MVAVCLAHESIFHAAPQPRWLRPVAVALLMGNILLVVLVLFWDQITLMIMFLSELFPLLPPPSFCTMGLDLAWHGVAWIWALVF